MYVRIIGWFVARMCVRHVAENCSLSYSLPHRSQAAVLWKYFGLSAISYASVSNISVKCLLNIILFIIMRHGILRSMYVYVCILLCLNIFIKNHVYVMCNTMINRRRVQPPLVCSILMAHKFRATHMIRQAEIVDVEAQQTYTPQYVYVAMLTCVYSDGKLDKYHTSKHQDVSNLFFFYILFLLFG